MMFTKRILNFCNTDPHFKRWGDLQNYYDIVNDNGKSIGSLSTSDNSVFVSFYKRDENKNYIPEIDFLWQLKRRLKKYNKIEAEQSPKPIELTFEEKRAQKLKNEIGKHIILWKAKTLQTTITRDPEYAYTNDAAGYRYVSHYADHIHDNITSAETIEGVLEDVTTEMIKVNNQWYTFGYDAEKIYEYKIIPE
jgi:hypothetical protein